MATQAMGRRKGKINSVVGANQPTDRSKRMAQEEKRVIEINGVKMEVDLRHAKVVENYKVGDSVKVLKKRYSDYAVYPGVIIGFTEFTNLPTIELLIMNSNDGTISFTLFNAESEDIEIAPFNRYEALFQKSDITDKLQRVVTKAEEELRLAELKLSAFTECFAKAFETEMINV